MYLRVIHTALLLVRSVNPKRLGQSRRRFDVSLIIFLYGWLHGRLLGADAIVLRVLQQVAPRGLRHDGHHTHLILLVVPSAVLVGRSHDVRSRHLYLTVVAHDVDFSTV